MLSRTQDASWKKVGGKGEAKKGPKRGNRGE